MLGVVVVADHLLVAIAGVDGRLEDFHLLFCKLCTAQAADELLRLARKHGTAHYFYSAWAACLARCRICNHGAKIVIFNEKRIAKSEKFIALCYNFSFFINISHFSFLISHFFPTFANSYGHIVYRTDACR